TAKPSSEGLTPSDFSASGERVSNKKTRNTAAEMLPMATCSARLRLMYENPEPSSLQNPVRASTATASNPGRRLRNAVDTRNDAESTANATLGPQRPTR